MKRSFRYTEENSNGQIELLEGTESIAQMTYSRMDAHNVIIDHTEVDQNVKGTGAETQIVEGMVHWARENDQKVLPLCPFTKAALEKHAEWHDVIRK